MSLFDKSAEALNNALKLFHTVDLQLKTLEKNQELIRSEFAASRIELLKLEGRVAQLEEARKTVEAQIRAVQAETIAELRAVKAETVAELKIQQMRKEAELYARFVDAQSQKPALTPSDEK